jgi:hypothetical protein
MKDKVFGSDGILGTVTPPQLNHDLYRVMRSKKN